MDMTTTLIFLLISVTATLEIAGASIHELHCFNVALNSFRAQAFETLPITNSYFSSCTIDPQQKLLICDHKRQRILLLGVPNHAQ